MALNAFKFRKSKDVQEEYQISDLQMQTDMEQYITILEQLKSKVIILLAIKDTPGNNMPEVVIDRLKNLGFSNISKQLWLMYTGIINRGAVVLDEVSQYSEDILKNELEIENSKIELLSASWRNGNRASIKVDGLDYACNRRGLNIVVLESETKRPIDSICYDSHENRSQFYRYRDALKKWEWFSEERKFDVALVGFWYSSNYGSVLNGFAVHHLLEKFGKSVLLVNKPDCTIDDPEMENKHNIRFLRKMYKTQNISPYLNSYDANILNKYVDTFISGSDQIWRYSLSFNGFCYLPFVDSDKRRISFCTSSGESVRKLAL